MDPASYAAGLNPESWPQFVISEPPGEAKEVQGFAPGQHL